MIWMTAVTTRSPFTLQLLTDCQLCGSWQHFASNFLRFSGQSDWPHCRAPFIRDHFMFFICIGTEAALPLFRSSALRHSSSRPRQLLNGLKWLHNNFDGMLLYILVAAAVKRKRAALEWKINSNSGTYSLISKGWKAWLRWTEIWSGNLVSGVRDSRHLFQLREYPI